MQDVFIGRQPIYDARLEIVAYELLFRSGSANHAVIADDDEATGQVLLNCLVNIGLDKLVGSRRAFINLTRRFFTELDLLPIDKQRVALEILETIEPDAQFLDAVRMRSAEGFQIVLDDFVFADKYRQLVELADIVKLDFRALDFGQLRANVQILRRLGVKQLLAEKIETLDEFKICLQLGFDLFQGHFLARPTTVTERAVTKSQQSTLQLLAKLQSTDVDVTELTEIIGRDVRLSYKLLRYLNSAGVGLRRQVDSIRQAITLLGLRQLRTLATLFTLVGTGEKPHALLELAVTRSQMCESLARALKRPDVEGFAAVGLFSTLDALLENRLENVLDQLPVTDELKQALLQFQGVKGEVYRCVLAAERGEWDTVACPGLTRDQIYAAYLESIAQTETASALID